MTIVVTTAARNTNAPNTPNAIIAPVLQIHKKKSKVLWLGTIEYCLRNCFSINYPNSIWDRAGVRFPPETVCWPHSGLFGRERYPESRCHADAPRRLPHWMTFGRYHPNEEKVTLFLSVSG